MKSMEDQTQGGSFMGYTHLCWQ